MDELVETKKELLISPQWDSKSNARYLELTVPLVLQEDSSIGFRLRVKTSKLFMGRDSLCQLEFVQPINKICPLWRCEWNPVGLHNNRNFGPEAFRNIPFSGSHEHRFDDNWIKKNDAMRSTNLPIARPLEEGLADFATFLAFCGKRFRIININRIQIPSISPDLFWTRDE